jgi:hypothetical protein
MYSARPGYPIGGYRNVRLVQVITFGVRIIQGYDQCKVPHISNIVQCDMPLERLNATPRPSDSRIFSEAEKHSVYPIRGKVPHYASCKAVRSPDLRAASYTSGRMRGYECSYNVQDREAQPI